MPGAGSGPALRPHADHTVAAERLVLEPPAVRPPCHGATGFRASSHPTARLSVADSNVGSCPSREHRAPEPAAPTPHPLTRGAGLPLRGQPRKRQPWAKALLPAVQACALHATPPVLKGVPRSPQTVLRAMAAGCGCAITEAGRGRPLADTATPVCRLWGVRSQTWAWRVSRARRGPGVCHGQRRGCGVCHGQRRRRGMCHGHAPRQRPPALASGPLHTRGCVDRAAGGKAPA